MPVGLAAMSGLRQTPGEFDRDRAYYRPTSETGEQETESCLADLGPVNEEVRLAGRFDALQGSFALVGAVRATGAEDTSPAWLIYVPVAAILIAIISLALSFANRHTATEALKLSRAQENRRKAVLKVSIDESRILRDSSGDRHVAVKVLAVNESDRDGSIVEATLQVAYVVGGAPVELLVPPVAGAVPPGDGGAPLEIPKDLKGNSAARGWLVFRLINGLVPGHVDRQTVLLRDSRGPTVTLDLWAPKEVLDEP